MTNLTEAARQDMDALANRLFDAIERADVATVEQIYAPDVQYWVNFTDQTLGLDTILEMTQLFTQKVKNFHYKIESREFFPGGFVQRCRITGELASGEALALPLCLVIYVEDGQITRLYEYINVASFMPVFA
jgi:ketosteroid isomerase-like protein